jgi:predicted patatin/cPLA2 family phospholipase
MNLNNKQVLIDEQLSKVNAPIFINDVIGDESRCVVAFKGRTTNFIYDENLGDNINIWLNNLPVITVNEIKEIMNKYKISLEKISELLEDEELIKIENIEEWVNTYNEQDDFLSIDVIDRIVKVNL